MPKRSLMVALLLLLLLASSCERSSEVAESTTTPAATTDTSAAIREIGVYVQTPEETLLVTSFGSERVDVMTNRVNYPLSSAPVTVRGVPIFVVNVPDAIVSDSAMYAFDSLDRASWYAGGSPSDLQPLPVSIQRVSNGAYRVEQTSDIFVDRPRYAALRLKMPMGASDRLYVVTIAW